MHGFKQYWHKLVTKDYKRCGCIYMKFQNSKQLQPEYFQWPRLPSLNSSESLVPYLKSQDCAEWQQWLSWTSREFLKSKVHTISGVPVFCVHTSFRKMKICLWNKFLSSPIVIVNLPKCRFKTSFPITLWYVRICFRLQILHPVYIGHVHFLAYMALQK